MRTKTVNESHGGKMVGQLKQYTQQPQRSSRREEGGPQMKPSQITEQSVSVRISVIDD